MSAASARNKANRGKGKRWESELREGFRKECGFDIEKLRDTGAKDEGDLVLRDIVDGETFFTVIEAKNAKFEPGVFMAEAELEGKHFAEHRGLDADKVTPVAIVKRRGHGFRKAYVLTTVEHYFDLEPVK